MKLLTTDQLVEIYERRLRQEPAHVIAGDLGINIHTVFNVQKRLTNIRAGIKPPKKYGTYIAALKILKKKFPPVENSSLEVKVTDNVSLPQMEDKQIDRYEKLDKAMNAFTAAITEFIDSEVGHIKRENEEMKKALEGNKMNNWVSSLKTKYNGGQH